MVVECINCEYDSHKGDANLPFDAELSDIKISLRMENKLHHMLCPDVMYYGSRMVQVSPLDHDGSRENWVVFHCYQHFQSDGSYTDKRILQHTCNGAENIRKDIVVVQPKETKEQRAGRH
jgi:hypothetical protein